MPQTEELFRSEPYTRTVFAAVTRADDTGICLDRTIFYPTGGGQPGDVGYLEPDVGPRIVIVDCIKGDDGEPRHVPAPGASLPPVGTRVNAVIDWPRRHRLMRMHTCLHLLCSLVPGAVTGGSVGVDKGRLDFDLPENTLDKDRLQRDLEQIIHENRAVKTRWIGDAELAAQPDLVRTMSVRPPSGQGRVRLVEVAGTDLQPCGGTHVAATGEIGDVVIGKIEKKGRLNRRVNLRFAD